MPAYTLDDPRPLAAECPYTFWLPAAEELAALAPGDLVKLIFRPVERGRKWGAERMWVTIEHAEGDALEGRLDNDPEDMPGLSYGDRVRFARHHVIDRMWAEPRATAPPRPTPWRDYWDRCLVDRCVIADEAPVHYLYREPPEPPSEDEEYPDSGWRVRGDYRGLGDEEVAAREVDYVAVGLVLNADDSWLHLIDSPVGSAFIRDWDSGEFVPQPRNL